MIYNVAFEQNGSLFVAKVDSHYLLSSKTLETRSQKRMFVNNSQKKLKFDYQIVLFMDTSVKFTFFTASLAIQKSCSGEGA